MENIRTSTAITRYHKFSQHYKQKNQIFLCKRNRKFLTSINTTTNHPLFLITERTEYFKTERIQSLFCP